MSTTYILTFYAIFIPVALIVLYAGYKIGYYIGKNGLLFPHTRNNKHSKHQ